MFKATKKDVTTKGNESNASKLHGRPTVHHTKKMLNKKRLGLLQWTEQLT